MLEALRRIVQEVNAAKDLDHALAIIVARVKEAMSADVCSVYLTDFNRNEHVLMATDMLEAMGHSRVLGNNVTINLEPDTREETERLYAALSEGGSDATGLADMPWGAYWGCCMDRFGIRWMFNHYHS